MPDRFVLRLALFYGAFFVYLGLSMPFIPAWLAVKGLDAREIGIVLAAPMVVRVIAVPLATRIADRFGMLRPALIAASLASVLGFALVGAVSGFVAILAAYALATAMLAPVLPFADAFALRGLRKRSASYGSVRLWGSVTFIVANLGDPAIPGSYTLSVVDLVAELSELHYRGMREDPVDVLRDEPEHQPGVVRAGELPQQPLPHQLERARDARRVSHQPDARHRLQAELARTAASWATSTGKPCATWISPRCTWS